MTEKTTRRKRALLVPLLGIGVAAWVLRRRLDERHGPDDGWHTLPPAPRPVPAPPAPEPVAAAPAPAAPAPAAPIAPAAMPPVAMAPVAAARARAVPAAAAVASVATPARPDVPGAVRALADGSSPDPGYAVKGKVATKTFHVLGGAYYTRTRADVWFRTADDARAAGFTERTRRHS